MEIKARTFDRTWRYVRLALPLALVSLPAWAGGPGNAACLSVTPPVVTQPMITQEGMVQTASSPSLAFARYIANLRQTERPAGWQTVSVQIEASLPELAKEGRLEAIRRRGASGHSEYKVVHVEGDAMVKQQVIARYLTAERDAEAIPMASVAVSPANYKFRFIGSIASSESFVYVYQVTPRKKRAGLMEGQIWIDAATGVSVHQGGHLVKKPSVFVRRVELVRDTQLRDGVPYLETTRLSIDTRLVGRAELTIEERPRTESDQVMAAMNSNAGVRP